MIIKDKVALVTGAASGLGEATARRFIAEGAKVILLDVTEESGNALATELGPNAVFVKTDVTSEEDAQKAIDIALEKFGRIDIMVNVAGIGLPGKVVGKDGPIPLSNFQKVIDINLVGSMNMLRLAAHKMCQNEPNEDGERGVIINTSSIASFHGQAGQVSYSASKGAINSINLPIARDLARNGIRIAAVAPGLFYTPIYKRNPAIAESLQSSFVFPKRFGKPEEFADCVRFIVGNSMINGDTIRLDGAVRF